MALDPPRRHIAVLTGAGISAESGIPTFRGADGLWAGHRIKDVASPEGWDRNPGLVLHFYDERRRQVRAAQPNPAHRALARLEQGYEVTIITQNIDDLHERGGSTRVMHLHGEILKARSSADDTLLYDLGDHDIALGDTCAAGSQLRPHVVWFGEQVPVFPVAKQVALGADALWVIGTSLLVYPAALIAFQAAAIMPVLLIDPAECDLPPQIRHYRAAACQAVPQLVAEWLGETPSAAVR